MARRFRRRPSARFLFAAAMLLVVLARFGWDCLQGQSHSPHHSSSLDEGLYSVERVIDGDTLLVKDSDQRRTLRLRLIGIDCPECAHSGQPEEPWSREATQFTRRFVSQGVVRVRLDRRKLDRYDRWLAYVFVDDRMLNLELVRAGFARVESYPGDSPSISGQLRRAENEARANRCGVWRDVNQ